MVDGRRGGIYWLPYYLVTDTRYCVRVSKYNDKK